MRWPRRAATIAPSYPEASGRSHMIETGAPQKRVAVAREFVAQVFDGHDAERAREFFTEDIAWHGGTLGTVTGVDTIVPILGGFIGALSDIHADVQDVI